MAPILLHFDMFFSPVRETPYILQGVITWSILLIYLDFTSSQLLIFYTLCYIKFHFDNLDCRRKKTVKTILTYFEQKWSMQSYWEWRIKIGN